LAGRASSMHFCVTKRRPTPCNQDMQLVLLLSCALLFACRPTAGLGDECNVSQEGDGRYEPTPECDHGLVCSYLSNRCECPESLIEVGDDCVVAGTGQENERCPFADSPYCTEGLSCMKLSEGEFLCRPIGSASLGDSCVPDRGDCAEGLLCDSFPTTCIQPESIPQFYDCLDDRACRPGSSCVHGTCRVLGQEGDLCDSDPDCAGDRLCQEVRESCVGPTGG